MDVGKEESFVTSYIYTAGSAVKARKKARTIKNLKNFVAFMGEDLSPSLVFFMFAEDIWH